MQWYERYNRGADDTPRYLKQRVAQVGAGLSFECQKSAGAVLIMGDVAYRQDAVEKRHYAQYILTHHDSSPRKTVAISMSQISYS